MVRQASARLPTGGAHCRVLGQTQGAVVHRRAGPGHCFGFVAVTVCEIPVGRAGGAAQKGRPQNRDRGAGRKATRGQCCLHVPLPGFSTWFPIGFPADHPSPFRVKPTLTTLRPRAIPNPVQKNIHGSVCIAINMFDFLDIWDLPCMFCGAGLGGSAPITHRPVARSRPKGLRRTATDRAHPGVTPCRVGDNRQQGGERRCENPIAAHGCPELVGAGRLRPIRNSGHILPWWMNAFANPRPEPRNPDAGDRRSPLTAPVAAPPGRRRSGQRTGTTPPGHPGRARPEPAPRCRCCARL